MAFTSFRAGSGSYQAVRPLQINISQVIALNPSTQNFSVADANIASGGGSIADIDKDSLVEVNWANPTAADHTGLVIVGASFISAGRLAITFWNTTGSNITPTAGTQINLVVL